MKARIYVDASVVGGCEDEEFSEYSVQLMQRFVRGELVLVVSALTVQELAGAPDKVRKRLASVPEAHIEALQLDAEARELAEAYIAEGVITAKMRADAQHIAISTRGSRRCAGELELQAHCELAPDPRLQLCESAQGLSDT